MKREEGGVGGEMRGREWPLCEGKVRERREVGRERRWYMYQEGEEARRTNKKMSREGKGGEGGRVGWSLTTGLEV